MIFAQTNLVLSWASVIISGVAIALTGISGIWLLSWKISSLATHIQSMADTAEGRWREHHATHAGLSDAIKESCDRSAAARKEIWKTVKGHGDRILTIETISAYRSGTATKQAMMKSLPKQGNPDNS